MTEMPQKGQLKICNYYYIDSGKFFPGEFWIDGANVFESSSTPPLISLVQIQLTGTEATLGDGGPGQADTYMGQFPSHLEMRNHACQPLL